MSAFPLQAIPMMFAGWVNRAQQDVIDRFQVENRVFREQLGGKRLRSTDAQRLRLVERAKELGRQELLELGSLVTPDTLFR